MEPKWTPASDEEFEREYAAALAAEEHASQNEPRAVAARYDATTGRVEVELQNGCRFSFPAEHVQGLRGATDDQLAAIEVTASGYGLRWDALDADHAVWALLEGRFGSDRWMEQWGGSGWAARPAAEAVSEAPARQRRAS